MAKKDLTVEELKAKKKELDKRIYDLIKAFEKETGVKIDYIDFERTWDDEPKTLSTRPKVTGVSTSFDRSLLD